MYEQLPMRRAIELRVMLPSFIILVQRSSDSRWLHVLRYNELGMCSFLVLV